LPHQLSIGQVSNICQGNPTLDRSRFQFRQVFHLIDACLQVGGDPDSWRRVLAEGSREIFASIYAHAGEFENINDDETARVLHLVDTGWPTDSQRDAFIRYQIEGAHLYDPLRRAMLRNPRRFRVESLERLTDPSSYFDSGFYRDYMAPAGTGDQLIAIAGIANANSSRYNLLTCIRGRDAPLFTRYDRELMRLLVMELAPLIGPRLADSTDPICALTPRLRRALELLLEGHSEPAAAQALGVAKSTFHKYVMDLYRRYGVNSRAELLAKIILRNSKAWHANPTDIRARRIRREGAPMTRRWRLSKYIHEGS